MNSRFIGTIGGRARGDISAVRAELQHAWQLRNPARNRTIQQYLDAHAVKSLHIGAGGNVLKGWLNTDLEPQLAEIIYLDVSDPLPFDDGSLDFIFNEHLIEHLPHELGAFHLKECHRVLRPGGRVRIATPDLQFLIDIYQAKEHTEVQAKYIKRILANAFPETGFPHGAFVLNHFVKYWGHQFIYDETTLGDAIRRAGFAQARRWAVGQSDEPHLQNIEHHGDAISDEFNLLQTIVMEGTKA